MSNEAQLTRGVPAASPAAGEGIYVLAGGRARFPSAGCNVVLSWSLRLGPWVSLPVFISPFLQQKCRCSGYFMCAFSPWHRLLLTSLSS